ncbi:MAG: hypothetical protein ACOH5I_12645 [Oligoflexus sp.]
MHQRVWALGLLISLISCQREEARYLGEEETCANGYYFSLKSLACEQITGFFLGTDAYSQDQLQTSDLLRVPTEINGRSPFMVSFYYDVDFDASKFEIAVRRIENGVFLNPVYSDWKEVYVDRGHGWYDVRVTIPEGQDLAAGPAINQVQGHWLQRHGWLVEVKGGDPDEDSDKDRIPSWRTAGLEVDPDAPDQYAAKTLILGPVEGPDEVLPCKELKGKFAVEKLDFDMTVTIALKQPGLDWRDWGSVVLEVPQNTKAWVPFSFVAKDAEGICPPPAGPASRSSTGLYVGDGYLLQLDFYNNSGDRLELNSEDYLYAVDHAFLEVLPLQEGQGE